MAVSLWIYRLLLPAFLLFSLPGWLLKTARRGGFGSGLAERVGWYRPPLEFEPCGTVHLHAVSVGETLLALKLIRAWRERDPQRAFVLAIGTPTGMAVAREAGLRGLRVVYQPLDLAVCVRAYLKRFEPSALVLVEGEMWPNLMRMCAARGIPVSLVNARMSPRSRRRYERFADRIRPVFSLLDRVAVQEPEDAGIWERLGVPAERVVATGSLKFDPGGGAVPARRAEFAEMLEACRAGRPVVLAASTHAGEELLIARAVREAGGFFLCVPRHAERRDDVRAVLRADGFDCVLRSHFAAPREPGGCCLVVDTTGELRDWTAHADVVVIGKTFRGVGGQNPAEAVLAGKPLLFGPSMSNFEPLASRLVEAGGAWRVGEGDLAAALARVLGHQGSPDPAAARRVLDRHAGAAGRMLDLLQVTP